MSVSHPARKTMLEDSPTGAVGASSMSSISGRRRGNMEFAQQRQSANDVLATIFGPDLPSICVPRGETDNQSSTTSSSDEDEDEDYSSKSMNSSCNKSHSSFFIPGITARARCLEDEDEQQTEQKLSARSLYGPGASSTRASKSPRRKPPRLPHAQSFDTRSIDRSIDQSIDEDEELSCFDDDTDFSMNLEFATTKVICKKDSRSRRRNNIPTKRSDDSNSIPVPQVIETKEIVETSTVDSFLDSFLVPEGEVETSVSQSEVLGWTAYLKSFQDEQEKLDAAKGSTKVQAQLTSIRDLFQAQSARIQTSLREEVAKTA